MASLTGTIVNQDGSYDTGWYGETTSHTRYGGYSQSAYYVYLLAFTTPSWDSATSMSQSITFNLGSYKVSGESASLRYALCTSNANKQNYVNTHAAVSDAYQITSGTTSISGLSNAVTNLTLTINTSSLSPSTTYYLYIWAGTSDYCCVKFSGNMAEHSVSVETLYKIYTLTISQGTGSTITVKRNGTSLSNGASITYGDSLVITFSAKTGYKIATHTVNGSSFTSGNSHTVTGNVTVKSTATVLSYALSTSATTGSSVTVNRTSSPKKGAATGVLSNGATIYYSDVLTVTFDTDEEYELSTHTVNSSSFTSGGSHTVTGNVAVVAEAEVLSYSIGNGTSLDEYRIYIANGTGYDVYVAYIGNGTTWEIYN